MIADALKLDGPAARLSQMLKAADEEEFTCLWLTLWHKGQIRPADAISCTLVVIIAVTSLIFLFILKIGINWFQLPSRFWDKPHKCVIWSFVHKGHQSILLPHVPPSVQWSQHCFWKTSYVGSEYVQAREQVTYWTIEQNHNKERLKRENASRLRMRRKASEKVRLFGQPLTENWKRTGSKEKKRQAAQQLKLCANRMRLGFGSGSYRKQHLARRQRRPICQMRAN